MKGCHHPKSQFSNPSRGKRPPKSIVSRLCLLVHPLYPHCINTAMHAHAGPSSSTPVSTPSSSSSAAGKPDRLFVGNLAPTVDEYTLIQVFQKYGKITKLDFMFHKSGVLKGKPRGYAFVEFSNKDVSASPRLTLEGVGGWGLGVGGWGLSWMRV